MVNSSQGPPLPFSAPQRTLSQEVPDYTPLYGPPTSKMKSYPHGNTCQAVRGSARPLLQPQLALLPATPATYLPLHGPSTPHSQASFPGFLLLQAQLEGQASSSRQASLGCQRELTAAPWVSSHLELTHSSSGLRVCGELFLSPCSLQPQSNAREGSLCLCTMASELEQGLEPEFFPAWTAQAFAEMS